MTVEPSISTRRPGPHNPMDLDFLSHCGQCSLDNSELSQRVNRDSTFSRSQRFDSTETCNLEIGAQSVYWVGHISLPCDWRLSDVDRACV